MSGRVEVGADRAVKSLPGPSALVTHGDAWSRGRPPFYYYYRDLSFVRKSYGVPPSDVHLGFMSRDVSWSGPRSRG